MDKPRLTYLISSYNSGVFSVEEQNEFFEYIDSGEDKELYIQVLMELEQQYGDDNFNITPYANLARQIASIDKYVFNHSNEESIVPTVYRVHFLKTTWFRVAVAILFFAGIGAYLWMPSNNNSAITQNQSVPVKNNVLPGGNKAILKLSDGSEIILDNAIKGILAEQSGTVIKKTGEGNVVYSTKNNVPLHTVSYNTMRTPRGGQYQLLLSDGSKIWLNAESSITFPTAFTGDKREVTIEGEVFFEVVKNKEKPFIVKTVAEVITVLGTSFNVNAYPEGDNKTSLIEGSVKVNELMLKPGQAYLNQKIIATDLEQDTAWKSGFFNFENYSIDQAMNQLARWYDVTVEYKGKRRKVEFGGKMDRSLSLQRVIKGLEGIDGLHFELQGKKLTVTF